MLRSLLRSSQIFFHTLWHTVLNLGLYWLADVFAVKTKTSIQISLPKETKEWVGNSKILRGSGYFSEKAFSPIYSTISPHFSEHNPLCRAVADAL